ncbi:MAG: hypothetical protein Q8P25_05200, partial [Candidatus Curtissbacteria bacterium]|nr:hypothetical protein [Candidatus Curtissbacteria bacterium]
MLRKDRKNITNIIFFVIGCALSFWIFSASITDAMLNTRGALFWSRAAIVGFLFLAPFFLLFSYAFPKFNQRVSTLKIFLIMLPLGIALLFVPTRF